MAATRDSRRDRRVHGLRDPGVDLLQHGGRWNLRSRRCVDGDVQIPKQRNPQTIPIKFSVIFITLYNQGKTQLFIGIRAHHQLTIYRETVLLLIGHLQGYGLTFNWPSVGIRAYR